MAAFSTITVESESSGALDEPEIQRTVSAVRDGDRAAARLLYAATVRAVYRVVRAQCAGDSEAEDIVQETFLKAFRSIETYRPRKGIRFLAWLLKIASTTTRKSARSKRRVEVMRPESVDALQETALEALGANHQADLSEDRERALALALAQLADRERAVLTLRYASDLSALEVGQALALSEANVRKICERARQKILAHLATPLSQSDEVPRPYQRRGEDE